MLTPKAHNGLATMGAARKHQSPAPQISVHSLFEREMRLAADKTPTKVSATPMLGIDSSSGTIESASASASGFPSQGIQWPSVPGSTDAERPPASEMYNAPEPAGHSTT